MYNKILEEQGHGKLMDLPCPFFLKKSLFYKLFAWQAPNNAKPFSFRNFNVHYQGLATPTVCKKCTFQEKRAWQVLDAATPLSFQNFIVTQPQLKKRYCESLYHLWFLSKLSFKLEFVNFRDFTYKIAKIQDFYV